MKKRDAAKERPARAAVAEPPAKRAYLAGNAGNREEDRTRLAGLLERAGFAVTCRNGQTDPETALASARVALHVFDESADPDGPAFQEFLAAAETAKARPDLAQVAWLPPGAADGPLANRLIQHASERLLVTNAAHPAQALDEIRALIQAPDASLNPPGERLDLLVVAHDDDAASAEEAFAPLEPHFNLELLVPAQAPGEAFQPRALEAAARSKTTVVFFRQARDWAAALARELWKYSGGAGAESVFVLLSPPEPRANKFAGIRAPGLIARTLPLGELAERVADEYDDWLEEARADANQHCPYTGLRPYGEDDALFFVGRDQHIRKVAELLRENKYAMVTGASGDGKSSLMFAGVTPWLKSSTLPGARPRWRAAQFRPERRPLRNLALALARALRLKDPDAVEGRLQHGYAALADLYKESAATAEAEGRPFNLLVIADQFEEFFTNAENYRNGEASPEAQLTVNLLTETIRQAREYGLQIYVVFTMRSDYIGQGVAFRGFAELAGQSAFFVPRLRRDELQRVIAAPARLNGGEVSPRLVQRLTLDVGEGSDQLPVLQHALRQVWHIARKRGEAMDLLHYAMAGGLPADALPEADRAVFEAWLAELPEWKQALYERPQLHNVLNRHANELYESAHEYYNARQSEPISPENARLILRTAFACLTKIDENRAVRNRMSLAEITAVLGKPELDEKVVAGVIDYLREPGNTFIQPYVFDGPEHKTLEPHAVLDITHEALIRNWDKLNEWADDEYRSAKIFKDFKIQINRWLANGKSGSYLPGAGLYSYFEDWRKKQQPNAAWIDRYLEPGEKNPDLPPPARAEAYLADLNEFLRRSRARNNRSRRTTQAALVVIFGLFLISAYLYWDTRQKAEKAEADNQKILAQERELNEKQRIIQRNLERVAESNRKEAENQRLLAEKKLLQQEMQRKEAVGELVEARKMARYAEIERRIAENQKTIADNRRQAAEDQRKLSELQARIQLEKAEKAYEDKAEAVKQRRIAEQKRDEALRNQSLYLASVAQKQVNSGKAETGMLVALKSLPLQLDEPSRPYVPKAEAALYYAANAIVNRRPSTTFDGHKNQVTSAAFSQNGNRVVTTSRDLTARVWDAASGRQVGELRHNNAVRDAFFSGYGKYIVTVGDDFSARLWSAKNYRMLRQFGGHKDVLTGAAISADALRLATASRDKTVRLWDVNSGKLVQELRGHPQAATIAAFHPDSKSMITAGGAQAFLWDAITGVQIKALGGHNAEIIFSAYEPTGRELLTLDRSGRALKWDATTGAFKGEAFRAANGASAAALSQDGGRMAVASPSGGIQVFLWREGRIIGGLPGDGAVSALAFSPDGERLISTNADRTATIWDVRRNMRLADFRGHPGGSFAAAFSPDSRSFLLASDNFSVRKYRALPAGQALLDYVNDNLKTRELTSEEIDKLTIDEVNRYYLEEPRELEAPAE